LEQIDSFSHAYNQQQLYYAAYMQQQAVSGSAGFQGPAAAGVVSGHPYPSNYAYPGYYNPYQVCGSSGSRDLDSGSDCRWLNRPLSPSRLLGVEREVNRLTRGPMVVLVSGRRSNMMEGRMETTRRVNFVSLSSPRRRRARKR
jgi:hypothetical protein